MPLCTPEVAKKAFEDYCRAMFRGDTLKCYQIEQHYEMDGYPPEIVTVGFNALIEGKDHYEAIDAYLDGEEE